MIEIEIKSKINNEKTAIEKINQLGGIYSHTEIQKDIYFNAPDKDYKKTDEALRIRQIPFDDSEKYILTYKGPKLNSETKTRKELEVEIDDIDTMTNILIELGFKKSAYVSKLRKIYNYEDYTITIDTLEKIGSYMEIEYVTDNENEINTIQEKIMNLFEKMNITEGFEKRSYLELLESS